MKTRKIIFLFLFFTFISNSLFAQQCLWAGDAGGGLYDQGNSIVQDASGNSYVTGSFENPNNISFPYASFGSPSKNIISNGGTDIFVAKYDVAGKCIWVRNAGGLGYDIGKGIALDVSGNIYVTGSFEYIAATSNYASFGALSNSLNATTIKSNGGTDIFIAKYDPSGNCIWAKNGGGSGYDSGNGIAIDVSGSIYITGAFQYFSAGSYASFGNPSGILNATTIKSNGGNDVFLTKYDSFGNCIWAKNAGGINDDYGYGICITSNNLSITGSFEYSGISSFASFGSVSTSLNATTIQSNGGTDVFIAKYDLTGNCIWAKNGGGSGYDNSSSAAIDGSGNTYITGSFQYFSGGGYASFGTPSSIINITTIKSNGETDIFIAKYDPSGNCVWAKNAGGDYTDLGKGIALDANGNSYLTGSFSTQANTPQRYASFGTPSTSPSSTTILSNGGVDAFIAKYDPLGNCIWAKTGGGGGTDGGNGICVNACSLIGITGSFEYHYAIGDNEYASFGYLSPYLNSTTIQSYGGSDIFIAQYGFINPTITSNTSTIIYPGATGTFTYTVNNPSNMPLTYQWQYSPDGYNWLVVPNSSPYSGANKASLTITNAPANIAGFKYRLTVNGVCFGTITGVTTVCPLSNVILTTYNNVCITDAPFTLSGGSPAGGTYYVYKNNVPTNTPSTTFDPLFLGLGTHTIVYTYTYSSGCSYSASQQITIGNPSINTVSAKTCNSSVMVPFTISCAFFSGNAFKAQLSRADGIFDPSPYTLGTLTTTSAGTINGTLPASLPAGNYKIRVVGSNPSVVGLETSLSISLVGATQACPINAGSINCFSSYSNTLNNTGYQNDIGQPSEDIFYKFNLANSGTVKVSTCGTAFDTYVYLLNSAGTIIASNDDNGPYCSGTAGSISFAATPGDYYAVVEGYSNYTGNITTVISSTGGGCRQAVETDLTLNGQISLSPNPAASISLLEIGFDNISKVQLIDLQGKLVQNLKPESSQEINLSELAAGMYFINIHCADGIKQKKLEVIK